ncbi:hypothetical protein [Periweissella ghanensis]|uniref:Uncharacterized protein n=1 Tax=Periweissella ghanensis TaxID=467997 RepID=A0ABN8BTF5_9LACO|nr:hypothetical protein [Periweissella ghanensis]MCM0601444.1 hypothetical protein [Periweissella ghanensis]CAH0419496.1 hypothetical protein WGH24286_01955 [Periweissella ghanensis]
MDKLYGAIAIDIKNSKNIAFKAGYGTSDLLNFFMHALNERFQRALLTKQFDGSVGRHFTIKEGDMLFAIFNRPNYKMMPLIYKYLNQLYYSAACQQLIIKIMVTPTLIEFNTALVFNGKLQHDLLTVNDLDEINGNLMFTSKYMINALRGESDKHKIIKVTHNLITNLPFNLAVIVLEPSATDVPYAIDTVETDIMSALFYLAYSVPFSQNNLLSIRKIVFFLMRDSIQKETLYSMAKVLDQTYHIDSYKNTKQYIEQKDTAELSKISSRISKIIRDMDVPAMQHNIATVEKNIERLMFK